MADPRTASESMKALTDQAACAPDATGLDHALAFLERVVGPDVIGLFADTAGETNIDCIDESVQPAAFVLPEMFGVVNAFALTGTALVVLYIISIGILHTAHEGESLGKRYSTLWTPIRAALGVTFVAPLTAIGGFSVLQAIIIGLVILSNAGAIALWNTTVDYFVEHKTLLAKPPYIPSDPRHSFMALQAEACTKHQYDVWSQSEEGIRATRDAEAARNNNAGISGYGGGVLGGESVAEIRLDGQRPRRVSIDKDSKLNWNFGNCGSVTYSCDTFPSDSIEREYCNKTFLAQKKISAFFEQGVVPSLYENYFNGTEFTQGSLPPADQIPGGEGESIVFAADTHPIVQAIARADEVYASAYRAVTNAQNEDAGKAEIDRLMGEWADEVKGNWLLAGQWHWVLHKISHQSIGGMNMNPQWTVPNDKNLNYEELRAFQEYLKTFMEENEIIQFDHKGNPSGVRVQTITEDDGPVDLLNKIAGPRLWSMTTALDSNGDPIGQLANYGHMMINTSSGIIVTSFLLKAGGDQAGAIPGISWFGGTFVESVISSLVMLVMFLIGPLMLAGGFLAYYLPAIPFIFWMFGVIGWMIMICESLVAAPIWAGAHALPEGEGMSGRYAVQGYQMLTNVLFRPILLLLGLVMSMQVLQFICFLAIEGFKVVNHSITGTGAQAFSFGVSQYFAIVFMNMVLVGLILSLSHKSYEMIFETADNVMRWVGFGSRPLGEAQGEQATSRVYGGAAIYSRDAAGAAAAKSGNPSPHPDPGGHQAHNARTGNDTDYNGGGASNRGNTPSPGGGGDDYNGGGPSNSGNTPSPDAPSSTPQGDQGTSTGTGQQSPTDRSIQGGNETGNAGTDRQTP